MDNILKKLGKNIQAQRKKFGYSQEKLAELVDCSSTTISSIETGRSFLTVKTLEKLCKVFAIPPHILFNIEISENNTTEKNIEQITTIAKTLSNKEQLHVIEILKTFKTK